MQTYYKPSGKFSILSFLYFVPTALLIIPIISLIYAYLIWYIPFIYFNFFITIGFGFLVGFTVSMLVIKKGKVRNKYLAAFFGLFAAVVAIYFDFVVYVDLAINAGETVGNNRIGITVSNIKFLDVFALAIQPDVLLQYIVELNSVGTWGIRGATASGYFLTFVWLIEFIMIAGVSIFVNFITAKDPFCELSDDWYKQVDLPKLNFIENTEKLLTDLSITNLLVFDDLEIVDNKIQRHSVFTLYTAPRNREHYLTIVNKEAKINANGKADFDTVDIAQYLKITSQLSSKLLEKK